MMLRYWDETSNHNELRGVLQRADETSKPKQRELSRRDGYWWMCLIKHLLRAVIKCTWREMRIVVILLHYGQCLVWRSRAITLLIVSDGLYIWMQISNRTESIEKVFSERNSPYLSLRGRNKISPVFSPDRQVLDHCRIWNDDGKKIKRKKEVALDHNAAKNYCSVQNNYWNCKGNTSGSKILDDFQDSWVKDKLRITGETFPENISRTGKPRVFVLLFFMNRTPIARSKHFW